MKQPMKKSLKPMLLLMLVFSSFTLIWPGEKTPAPALMVTAGGNLFSSSDAGFRQIYGPSVFLPEIKITGLVHRNISVWGGFAFMAKKGFIEDVAAPAKIRQAMFSFGAGYVYRLNARLQLRAEAGMTIISYKEEALEETLKGSGSGWKIGASFDYFIVKKVFATLAASFSQASDDAQTGKVKLGGFQLGAGLGLAF
jgi:hypothetical protein